MERLKREKSRGGLVSDFSLGGTLASSFTNYLRGTRRPKVLVTG